MSAKQKSRYEALPYRCLTWLCSKLDILSPSTSTESTSLRPPSVDFGSVSRLQSPVPRREGVMLRCYRSNSGLKGSCLRPLAPCGSRASSDTASRQCSPIPESVESDISLLKEEVASLRKQFEELVVSQKDAEVRRSTSAMYTPTGAVLPPPPLSSLPPPPPPPPPPPSFFAPVQKVVVRKQRPRDPLIAQAEKSHEAMLAEVLKGLGTVKLKKVEKSPSGTPLRKGITESESSTSTDPASMLANALKKRFVHIHPPESSDDSAAEAWSPSSPDVQVKRRAPTRRRLSGRRNLEMSTVLSPMQEVGA
ncbi:mitochondrial fission regulator 2-like isoform X3 [Dermacentor albipictus]|uniref:mitochondrial fission regulator 2-like isoform X3 n=1 Tax=Dermacentor albipictus TaxID=60249 RepID=UPI0038FD2C04